MINSVFDFCQKANFEINLFQLIEGLSTLVLITMIILAVNKILYILKKEREIDGHVRETSVRIARFVTEIEGYKEAISTTQKWNQEPLSTTPTKLEDTISIIEGDQTIKAAEVPSIQEVSVPIIIQKEKKTRAMSMEERWAEYDKKRAIRNTA